MVLGSILLHASLHDKGRKNKNISLFVHTGSAYAYCNALNKTGANVQNVA